MIYTDPDIETNDLLRFRAKAFLENDNTRMDEIDILLNNRRAHPLFCSGSIIWLKVFAHFVCQERLKLREAEVDV